MTSRFPATIGDDGNCLVFKPELSPLHPHFLSRNRSHSYADDCATTNNVMRRYSGWKPCKCRVQRPSYSWAAFLVIQRWHLVSIESAPGALDRSTPVNFSKFSRGKLSVVQRHNSQFYVGMHNTATKTTTLALRLISIRPLDVCTKKDQ